MEEIKGKYNSAKVYTNVLEDIARNQIKDVCDMEIFKESKIRIMPDVHAGAGCTIGTTMTLHGAVVPNMVGVDIGCGMELIQIKEKDLDLEKLDQLIKDRIPCGRNIRKRTHEFAREINLKELRCIKDINHLIKESRALGSLGGGNHFIEVDKDEEGNLYVVIHSGSRHIGKEVAEIYQEKAYKQLRKLSDKDIEEIINDLKKQGKQKEIETTLQRIKKENKTDIQKQLAYCVDEVFDDYIHDMSIMQRFADLNRKAMMKEIVDGMDLHIVDQFTTIHNYIDIENMILRKGAVSARKGERLLIPINMRDGSLICIGKGNPDWNYSAPHGAGRIMSRSKAFKTFNLDEFRKEMQGIYTTTANTNTIDEAPMAYKSKEDIINNIGDTVEIIKNIIPIYNFKAQE